MTLLSTPNVHSLFQLCVCLACSYCGMCNADIMMTTWNDESDLHSHGVGILSQIAFCCFSCWIQYLENFDSCSGNTDTCVFDGLLCKFTSPSTPLPISSRLQYTMISLLSLAVNRDDSISTVCCDFIISHNY